MSIDPERLLAQRIDLGRATRTTPRVESLYGRGLIHRPDLTEAAKPFRPGGRYHGLSVQQFEGLPLAQWYANTAPAYWEPRGEVFAIIEAVGGAPDDGDAKLSSTLDPSGPTS